MMQTQEPVLRKSGTRRGRFWGAGALVQPWLTSASAFREDPAGWLQAAMFRTKGRLMKRLYRLPSVSLSSIVGTVELGGEAISEGICLPPFCGGTHDDFGALMRIVATVRPEVVLELGTAYGNTVANICRECPNVRVYTVNAPPEEMSGELTTYALSREDIGSIYERYGFGERVVQIYCDTLKLDLSQYLAGPVIDLAIVDACHDPKHVVNDFLKVIPYVRSHGVVLLHDTHPSLRGHLWGSYLGCMTLRSRGYDIRHVANTWWAVWHMPGDQGPSKNGCREDSVG